MSGRWERFCVVGVGSHARNRLIPAIRANGQILVGVVLTRQLEWLGRALAQFSADRS